MLFKSIQDQWSARACAPALIAANEKVTWKALVVLLDRFEAEVRDGLSVDRPLVMLEAQNNLASIVAYLACLRAEWPVIPVAPGQLSTESAIGRTFMPNILVCGMQSGTSAAWEIVDTGAPPAAMHASLAVLLSTSGSTGAPKLVRLSKEGLLAGADAIVAYLGITPADRAITALPFHYSYGMSVVHSQLLAGAALVLTQHSVSESEFWEVARDTCATSVALVPTQIESMLADGWQQTSMPSLRYITQAGGRLDPGLIRRFAHQAQREHWQLVIMYGQTEAGPRIAYLPPEDLLDNLGSIGRAVPGSRLRLVGTNGQEITETGVQGELVFEGPAIMQGYATERAGLATPEGPKVLHTGDLAERSNSGYFRIVGRSSRFLKLHGLRIGLDEVEVRLREEGHAVYATGSDTIGLFLFLRDASEHDATALADDVARNFKLPTNLVTVEPIGDVPLLPSGKIDYRALSTRAEKTALTASHAPAANFLTLLTQILRTPTPDMQRSFRETGGDSLAYLSVQLHFANARISLPDDWDALPLVEIAALEREAATDGHVSVRPRPQQWMEANLAARVLSLFAIIALHSTAWPTGGGGYLLLALVGYSLARFQFVPLSEGRISQMLQVMLLPILTTYFAVVVTAHVFWEQVPPAMFYLVANLRPTWAQPEPYWFVSAYAQLVLFAALLFMISSIRQRIAGHPFFSGLIALALAALAFSLFDGTSIEFADRYRNPLGALELAALGWGAWFAADLRQKVLMSLVMVGIWQLHWADMPIGIALFCFGGLLTVLWRLRLPVPPWLLWAATKIASLALFIYICHPIVISAAVRLLPAMPDLLRFIVVSIGSVLAALVAQWLYKTARTATHSLWRRRGRTLDSGNT